MTRKGWMIIFTAATAVIEALRQAVTGRRNRTP